jgi:hypothetical protein
MNTILVGRFRSTKQVAVRSGEGVRRMIMLVSLAWLCASPAGRSEAQAQCSRSYPNCGFCAGGVAGRWQGSFCYWCNSCMPALAGTAEAVATALGGPKYAEADGDTVVLKAAAQDGEPRMRISLDADMLRATGAKHAAVALVLASVYLDPVHSDLNLLKGAAAFSGMPTSESVELTLQGLDPESVKTSFAPIDPNTFVQVRWEARMTDENTAEVTFQTELIDERTIIQRVVASPLTLSVSRH